MSQTEGEEMLPMLELLGLDKQLRSIRGSLKVEVAKKVQLGESIKKEHCKLEELRNYPGAMMMKCKKASRSKLTS